MTVARTPVGVVGTGLMGFPMAERLLAGSHPVVACNRTISKAEPLARHGATIVGTAGQVGSAASTVLLALPSGAEVADAVAELLTTLPHGSMIVDTSTIAPAQARQLHQQCADAGIAFVDAPVSGGPTAVVAGTLSVMAGGTAADLDRAAATVAPFAGRFVRCGPPGSGQVAKACNQLVVATTIEVVAEALVLAAASGVDAAAVRHALLGGYASSRILELHGARMLRGDFTPGGKARLQLKDINLIRDLAADAGLPLVAFEAAAQRFDALIAAGDGELDQTAVVTVLERIAGVTVRGTDE